eukprot:CAMPEP_0196584406 /NCGR_PEP_ID=MMETSP1081-20130531/46974_1 /TAXON_ID=36882 /ORGANISM="Pyramimonas amylifera, Strain CCMP720" /LENGTH=220 /DNA_ID=CAMNT_0041905601 /DNA_START=172 /DNA_END=834 /DNA_ORIENTATION=-
MSMNPFCEIAIEEAVRLKENGYASEVRVVSVGPSSSQETLRSALALGASSATHILTNRNVEPLGVARLLAEVARKYDSNLVLLGKQSIDEDNSQTGQMLAGLLGWPQATNAFKLTVLWPENKLVEVVREVDAGLETLRLALPAVVTVNLRMNSPRFATLPGILKAKKQPIEILSAQDFGVDITPHTQIMKLELPPKRPACKMVTSVDELINLIRTEAKVI